MVGRGGEYGLSKREAPTGEMEREEREGLGEGVRCMMAVVRPAETTGEDGWKENDENDEMPTSRIMEANELPTPQEEVPLPLVCYLSVLWCDGTGLDCTGLDWKRLNRESFHPAVLCCAVLCLAPICSCRGFWWLLPRLQTRSRRSLVPGSISHPPLDSEMVFVGVT